MVQHRWQRTGLWLIAGAVLTAAAGCPLPSSSELAVQWATPLNNLGLVVVDPPREDMRVGDIYLYPTDPETQKASTPLGADQRRIGMMTRWMTLPVLGDVETQYRGRPEWPPVPLEGNRSIFATDVAPARLRSVSLTGASATVMGREEASALIPAELDNLVPGLGLEDYKGITVTTSSAEMYALGLDAVLGLLLDEQADGGGFVLKEEYRRFLPLMALADSEVVWLRVVSEVVYMRNVDFTVQPATPPDSVEDVPPPDMTAVKAPPPMIEAPSDDPAVIPFQRAERINQLLAASNNNRLPDSTMRVMSVTDTSASLRVEWARGLAIAVRGVTLEVDKSTGAVRRMGAMGQEMPRQAQPDQAGS
jgi:hypothetical protein